MYIGDLSPFDFFRQETSNIDVEVRTEAMKKVAIVAALSGPEKSRTDILAYLQSEILFFILIFNNFMVII